MDRFMTSFKSYHRELYHGGDLDAAISGYGGTASSWLDLSTGINPVPYPVPALPPSLWNRLPESGAETALLKASRHYYRIPETMGVTACPGTQSAIQILPSLFKPSNVAILSPTYAEHRHCWQAHGHNILEVARPEDIPPDCSVIILVSPNNPTGWIPETDILLALHQHVKEKNGLLVMDEAFMDCTPDKSCIPFLSPDHLAVLKSFGKFFGLAGLRLGFAIGDPKITREINRRLGPWAVSGPASHIGAKALSDSSWISKTRQRLKEDKAACLRLLTENGLVPTGGTDLFTLIQDDQANLLFRHLCDHQILSRPFSEHPSLIRLGHPASEADHERLSATLNQFHILSQTD